MVVTIDVKHVFKYPMEFVANTHFTKYPSKKEKFVRKIDVIERSKDTQTGIDYRKSVAECDNVVPTILRTIKLLDVKAILLEEESWFDMKKRHLMMKSRNLTWNNYADMTEHSVFKTDSDNPSWTVFEQQGRININGIGPFGRVIEMFAEKFLHSGVKRSLNIMEDLLKERYTNYDDEKS